MADIVLVEHEAVTRQNFAKTLERDDHQVRVAESAEDALALVAQGLPDLLIAEQQLPGMSGDELLATLRTTYAAMATILLVTHDRFEQTVGSLRSSGAEYLRSPATPAELLLAAQDCLQREALRRQLHYYRDGDLSSSDAAGIVGNSPSTQRLRSVISRLASLEKKDGVGPTILLTGETGTGKGLTARAIHKTSARRDAPFIEVRCTAMPDSRLEAELMGYERRDSPEARSAKAGLFEAAEGGTIFFDEIGRMKTILQSKLLKIIDDRSVRRLGSTRDRAIHTTIITATHLDLEQMVRDGSFLHDLYHRINVVKIELSPLRNRDDDVLALADCFLRSHSGDYGMDPPRLSDGAISALRNHSWPGNVRELSHTIERALAGNPGPVLTEHDLALASRRDGVSPMTGATVDASLQIDFTQGPVRIEDVEVRMIKNAMEFTGGNQAKSARLLGLSRDAFRYRLEKHGLR